MSNNKIKLGLMPPLTGLVALYGEEIVRAAKIAVDEINESGGLLGNELELIIEDDGSLPDTAVPAAHKLVDLGCTAIIGNLLSNSRISVANQVADKRKIPYLNFSFYEGSIYSPYFFHFAALPNQQIDKMIPYMANKYGSKFFFAGSNYEWPRGSIDAAKMALSSVDGEVVGEEYLPIGSEKMDSLLDKVKKSGADVFVPYFAGQDQVNLLTGFTELGLKNRMAVVMGHYDETMVSNLSAEVREGFYSSNTYFMDVETPENKDLLSRLKNCLGVNELWPKGNGIITNFGEGTYICVKAFGEAVKLAGSLDVDIILKSLENIQIAGPQGKVTMDPETHHATVNSYLSKCNKDGSFRIIEKFGEIKPIIPKRYHTEMMSRKLRHKDKKSTEALTSLDENNNKSSMGQILAITDVSVIAIGSDGNIMYVNRNTCELFKYKADELIGKSVNILLPPRYRNSHGKSIMDFLHSDETDQRMSHRGEISGYTKNGEEFPAQASLSKIITKEGTLMVASLKDVSERKKMEEELTWKATHDPLTKLANRNLMKERIKNALARTLRSNTEIALLFLDLDNFKRINDTHGQEEGDNLLLGVTDRLVNAVRPGDTIARVGGDEFVLLCEQIEHENEAVVIANRLVIALRDKVEIANTSHYISGSIGLAFGNGYTHSAEELLKNADIAMYEAKNKGRDSWRIFSADLEESVKMELEIANGLHTALENHEIKAFFQPIYDITGNEMIGAELLARWIKQDKMIPPDLFIPIAEKSGVINELGYFVFREGCFAQVKTSKMSPPGKEPFISINVSTKQLDDPHFINKINGILSETGAKPELLILEITESSLMSNADKNIQTLACLKEIGLSTAVDDFGTGYSSLSYLSKMPVKKIKIDKSFIDYIDTQKDQKTIVNAVIMMAKTMNIEIVAEGVETKEQLNILNELGCDNIQGYLFSKPLPSKDFFNMFS
ncbi:MAG: ABC transporter substrate-binding protein [Leptospirales bacterium]